MAHWRCTGAALACTGLHQGCALTPWGSGGQVKNGGTVLFLYFVQKCGALLSTVLYSRPAVKAARTMACVAFEEAQGKVAVRARRGMVGVAPIARVEECGWWKLAGGSSRERRKRYRLAMVGASQSAPVSREFHFAGSHHRPCQSYSPRAARVEPPGLRLSNRCKFA